MRARAWRLAGVFALGVAVVEACGGELPKPDSRPVSPGLGPDASAPPRVTAVGRSVGGATTGEGGAAVDLDQVDVRFLHGTTRVMAPACSLVFIAAAKGKVTLAKDVLQTGDVLIVKYPDPMYVDVEDLALQVIQPFLCQLDDKPGPEVSFRRVSQAPELTWANGEMHAHLDVEADVSPSLYLGRLSGTAGVAEHVHATSIEILAAVEASGTFTLAGAARRLGPREIVKVPANTPHSWKPDPSSKLVALQLYLPPGPEQRFRALDAAGKDAGRDGATPVPARPR